MKQGQIPSLLLLFEEVLNKGFDGHLFVAGLASHFRDLQVAKQPSTLPLLEVTEETKQRYLEQSAQWTISELIEAIDLANQCDLQYKASKNQRLLVELCLMKLASISAEAEKKNGNGPLPAAQVPNQKAKPPVEPWGPPMWVSKTPCPVWPTAILPRAPRHNRG